MFHFCIPNEVCAKKKNQTQQILGTQNCESIQYIRVANDFFEDEFTVSRQEQEMKREKTVENVQTEEEKWEKFIGSISLVHILLFRSFIFLHPFFFKRKKNYTHISYERGDRIAHKTCEQAFIMK